MWALEKLRDLKDLQIMVLQHKISLALQQKRSPMLQQKRSPVLQQKRSLVLQQKKYLVLQQKGSLVLQQLFNRPNSGSSGPSICYLTDLTLDLSGPPSII